MDANTTLVYQLRKVLPRDAVPLRDNCWPDKSLDSVRDMLNRVDGIARQGRGMGIVAEIGQSPLQQQTIAYAQLTIWPRVGEISDLIVMPEYRQHGIGTAMIHYLIDKARIWPMTHVEIGVAQSNPRAYQLYKRLGFADERIVWLDLGSGLEEVLYLTMALNRQ